MALSGKFFADFASFYDAVQQADVKLKKFGEGSAEVGVRLNRMVDQFSGRKVQEEAALMVRAIEEAGGVSKLTQAELQRVGAQAAEAGEKMRKLGVEVPKGLDDIAAAGQRSAFSIEGITKSVVTMAAGWLTAQAALNLAKSVWSTFVGVLTDSISAASGAEDSQASLTAALRAQGTAVPSVVDAYDEYAAALQRTTAFEDDAAQSAMALLVQVGNVMPRDMEAALTATSNLAAGMKMDLGEAAMVVAKAATGTTTSLGKLGVEVKDNTGKAKDFAGVLDAVNAKFGGQAAAAANTYAGRIAQLKNAWDDVLESIGRAIITNGTVLEAINGITQAIIGETNELNQNQQVMNLISDVIVTVVRGLALLIEGFSRVSTVVADTYRDLALLAGWFAKLVDGLALFMRALAYVDSDAARLAPKLEALAAGTRSFQERMNASATTARGFANSAHELSGKVNTFADNLGKTRGVVVDTTRATQEATGAWERHTTAIKADDDATKKALEAQKRYEESLRAIVDNLSGGGAIDQANLWMQALQRTIPITQMTREKQDAINKAMGEALAAYTAMGIEPPQAMVDLWAATLRVGEATRSLTAAAKDLPTEQVTLFAKQTVDAMGMIITKTESALESTKGLFSGFGKTVSGAVGSSIIRAIEGGGNIVGSIGSTIGNAMLDPKQSGIGKAIDTQVKKLPGILGSTISSILPGLGSMLGPAVSLIGKGFSKLFGKGERSKIDEEMRAPFIAAAGGLEALNEKARQAGVTLNAMMDAGKVDDYNAAVKQLEEAFAFQKGAMDLAIETAQRYGFTLEELGPALGRAELDKQAQQLYQDFEVLNAAGIDSIAINEKMADAVNNYVHQALKMGAEVPESMRPMLQSMANMGLLTDANGNKIEDLEGSGLSFTMTMSEGFRQMIDAVTKLSDSISRGLGLSVASASDQVGGLTAKLKGVPQQLPVQVVYKDPGFKPKGAKVNVPASSGGGEELESYQGGTEGFRNFGAGTPVMLHGWEAVVPREKFSARGAKLDEQMSLLGGTPGGTPGGAPAVTIVINAQGAFFDTPGSLQRLADKVNEALTAKYALTHRMRAA